MDRIAAAVAAGAYLVDPLSVADAIIERHRRWRSLDGSGGPFGTSGEDIDGDDGHEGDQGDRD